jgi:hypothetical protein
MQVKDARSVSPQGQETLRKRAVREHDVTGLTAWNPMREERRGLSLLPCQGMA